MMASGTVPAATAVWYLVMTSAHGIVVTVTVASGFASVKAFEKSPRFSPSSPIAQIVISPVAGESSIAADEGPSPVGASSSARPQPARASAPMTPIAPMASALRRMFIVCPPHRDPERLPLRRNKLSNCLLSLFTID